MLYDDIARAYANDFLKSTEIMDEKQVYRRIEEAFNKKSSLSIVRLGDGEALTLAQDKAMPVAEVAKRSFLRYAGVNVPDLKGRDRLAFSVRKAGIVGIPVNLMPDFLPLLLEAFKALHINPCSMDLTNACINYFLYRSGRLKRFLLDYRPGVLVVGNKGKGLSRVLRKEGIPVSGTISPVFGLGDIDRVLRHSREYQYDVALVGAGVAAVAICERIASLQNKIAIDIGHVADSIATKGYL